MRSAAFVASILLVTTTLAVPTEAAGPIVPTLHGPTLVPAARNWTYTGQLVVAASGMGVPLAGQTVGLWLDGVRVSEDQTDAAGRWSAKVSFPVGIHALEARAFEGSLAEGVSNVLTVHSYPTWPAWPSLIETSEGFYWNQTNVTWLPPWTDGGYPVLSYDFARSHNGGPFVPIYSGTGLAFTDFDTIPGHDYTYRATTTTAYATSNATLVPFHATDNVATIELVGYRLCDTAGCANVTEGGSFVTSAIANVSVEVRTKGLVDVYPVAPPGVADEPVYGRVGLPEIARSFFRTSNATGGWNATTGSMWAYAPAAGCEAVGVVAHAQTDFQGRTEDVGFFDLCVA